MRNNFATGLSGGEQQRLNIMLAVAHKPKLLLLDELSTGLDVESRAEMKRIVKEQLKELNTTMILVSHNPDEIEYLADRIIVLFDGKIYEDITMKEINKKFDRFEDYVDDLFINRFHQEEAVK
jgi:ABC-2 type transport system ATP-binding protein